MESFQDHNEDSSSSGNPNEMPQIFLDKSLFSPFLVKTMKIQGDSGFMWEAACYNPKYNMIIACPKGTMQFYDATTFEPLKGRKFLDTTRSVIQIAFDPETDTYLMGCMQGIISKYNASKDELKELAKGYNQVLGMTFLNWVFYAFSSFGSDRLYVGNLDDETVLEFDLKGEASQGLCHLSKEKLLLTGLEDGSVRIYRTNKLPDLKAISSVKTGGVWIFAIQRINVNGKGYVVTASENNAVKIWHWFKGKMRLLKVLHNEKVEFSSLVYLENYKMIATSCKGNSVKFWRFPSMKLESTIYLSEGSVLNLFLIKEKNLIGVTNENESKIEFIQLHSSGS